MARDYAKVWLRITEDPDFRALTRGPQHLYLILLLSRTVNNAGVADWRAKRMSVIAKGWTDQQIETDAASLERARFIVVDRDSEEVLLRSFIRHDGIMAGPKTAQGMASAYRRTTSLKIRSVIVHELRRLRQEIPDSHAWDVDDVIDMLGNAVAPEHIAGMPGVPEAVANRVSQQYPAGMPGVFPSLEPLSLKALEPLHPAPAVLEAVEPEHFDEFWETYPRKVGRIAAVKGFTKAVRAVGADVLLDSVKKFAADPNLPNDRTKIPHASTWLSEGRWGDEPYPPPPPTQTNQRGPRIINGAPGQMRMEL